MALVGRKRLLQNSLELESCNGMLFLKSTGWCDWFLTRYSSVSCSRSFTLYDDLQWTHINCLTVHSYFVDAEKTNKFVVQTNGFVIYNNIYFQVSEPGHEVCSFFALSIIFPAFFPFYMHFVFITLPAHFFANFSLFPFNFESFSIPLLPYFLFNYSPLSLHL